MEQLTVRNFEQFASNLTPLNIPEWNDGRHIFVTTQFNNQYFELIFKDFIDLVPGMRVIVYKNSGSITELLLRMELKEYDLIIREFELNNPKKPNYFRCLYFNRITKEIAYKMLLIDCVFEVAEVKKQLALLTTQNAFNQIKTIFAGTQGFLFHLDHSTPRHKGYYYYDFSTEILRRYEDTLEMDLFAGGCLAEKNQTLKAFAKYFTKGLIIN
jgi:hypothetical protein